MLKLLDCQNDCQYFCEVGKVDHGFLKKQGSVQGTKQQTPGTSSKTESKTVQGVSEESVGIVILKETSKWRIPVILS